MFALLLEWQSQLLRIMKGPMNIETGEEKSFQLLSFTDDIDLNRQRTKRAQFYNFNRPDSTYGGKTLYEALMDILK